MGGIEKNILTDDIPSLEMILLKSLHKKIFAKMIKMTIITSLYFNFSDYEKMKHVFAWCWLPCRTSRSFEV